MSAAGACARVFGVRWAPAGQGGGGVGRTARGCRAGLSAPGSLSLPRPAPAPRAFGETCQSRPVFKQGAEGPRTRDSLLARLPRSSSPSPSAASRVLTPFHAFLRCRRGGPWSFHRSRRAGGRDAAPTPPQPRPIARSLRRPRRPRRSASLWSILCIAKSLSLAGAAPRPSPPSPPPVSRDER